MDRRRFLDGCKFSLAGILAWGAAIDQSRASYPVSAFRANTVEDVLLGLFDTTDAGEDRSIRIESPLEAEHAAHIPFRIVTPGASQVAVLVTGNTRPLVLFSDLSNYPEGIIYGSLVMERQSSIAVYVIRQGSLFWNSRIVRLPVAGFGEEADSAEF